MKKITLEKAREKLQSRFPYLYLLTYAGCEAQCLVVDTEYNERFEANYHTLIKGKTNCPSRSNYLRRKTCLEKYGHDNVQKVKSIKRKTEETNIKKYGTKSTFQNEKVKRKFKENYKAKYGVENPFQNEEIKQQIKNELIKKYGVDHAMKLQETKDKVFNTREKLGLVKHYVFDLPMCQWIRNSNPSIPYSSALVGYQKYGADFLHLWEPKKSLLEEKVKQWLLSLGVDFVHNQKILDLELRPDFLIPEFNLIIECNGLYWHSELFKTKMDHFQRREIFNSLGYRLLSFYEDQILYQEEICKSIIENALKINKNRVFARNLQILKVEKQKAKIFFKDNHLMGIGKGGVLGLYKQDTLVSAIQYFVRREAIEISRFCNLMGFSVVGGYSKLMKSVIKETNIKRMSTFIDLNYGTGEYLKLFGFNPSRPYPSFQWVDTDKLKRFHRLSFRGNSGYSHGLLKIWDAGQQNWKNY